MDDVMFASGSDRWGTPGKDSGGLFDQISDVFGPFDLDPCAEAWNAKAPVWFGPTNEDPAKDDGLNMMLCWAGNVFVNPPFSRKKKMPIEPWINKAWDEVQMGHASQVVMLIPARTETRIWHDVIWPHAAVIAFIKGRVNFMRPDGTTGPAPFPSAIVVFRPRLGGARIIPVPQTVMAWEQRR